MTRPDAFTKMRANRARAETPFQRRERLQREIDRIDQGFADEWLVVRPPLTGKREPAPLGPDDQGRIVRGPEPAPRRWWQRGST